MTDRDELVVRGIPLARIVGITGVVATVLLFGTFISGSPGEPTLNATTAEAAEYVRGLDATWVRQLEAVGDIAMFVLLWFMVGLALLLRRVDADVGDAAGAHRATDLDPGQLAYAYDVSHFGLANVWLPFGGFAFACGWIIISSGAMPRWLGRWGLISGMGLALAQFVWTVEVAWLLPYLAFWLWLLTIAVLLIRRRGFGLPEEATGGA